MVISQYFELIGHLFNRIKSKMRKWRYAEAILSCLKTWAVTFHSFEVNDFPRSQTWCFDERVSNLKLDFIFHMGIWLCGIFICIFCDSIKQSSNLSLPLGYSSTHLIMTSMKSFSFMVTSFRVCFIELKMKRSYFSLCLLTKENKIISEWWHFSNPLSILLHYLAPSACSYVLGQVLMKSRCRLVWFVGLFLFLPLLSQHFFFRG